MLWLEINSPRWTYQIQRWLYPGDVVEIADEDASAYAAHSTALATSDGHDVPTEATVTLRATRNIFSPDGEGFMFTGHEFQVTGARASEIPISVADLMSVSPPHGRRDMEARPAPPTDRDALPLAVEAPKRRRR